MVRWKLNLSFTNIGSIKVNGRFVLYVDQVNDMEI